MLLALVEGGMARDDAYRCEVEYLERDKQVKVGDRVLTSGLGGAIPAGLAVGTIVHVASQEYGLYQEVEVEPVVDFSRLRDLLVIVSPPRLGALTNATCLTRTPRTQQCKKC